MTLTNEQETRKLILKDVLGKNADRAAAIP